MFKTSPTLLVCVTVLFSLTVTADYEYDYLQLVLQWPPAVCFLKNKIPTVHHWTIHGLWPTKTITPPTPNDCYITDINTECPLPDPFTVDTALKNDMDIKWPDLLNGDNKKFWRDEYCKHGTCCDDILPGPDHYFKGTLELYDKTILKLNAASITPDVPFPTTFSELTQALGKDARYWCGKKNGKQYLKELGVCYDKYFVHIDCPVIKHIVCDINQPFYL